MKSNVTLGFVKQKVDLIEATASAISCCFPGSIRDKGTTVESHWPPEKESDISLPRWPSFPPDSVVQMKGKCPNLDSLEVQARSTL